MTSDPSYHAKVCLGTSSATLAGVSWVWAQLLTQGPGWGVVAPILMSAASLATAVVSGLRLRAELRRSDELHRQQIRHAEAEHAARLRRLADLAVEPLPPR